MQARGPESLSTMGLPPEVLRILDGLWQGDTFGLRKKQRHSPGNQAQPRFKGNRVHIEPLEHSQWHSEGCRPLTKGLVVMNLVVFRSQEHLGKKLNNRITGKMSE